MLEPPTHNKLSINDSFNFGKEIIAYDSSQYMASLDADSLFTNIPLNETISNYVSDQHKKYLYNGKLVKRDLFNFLETGTSDSSFIFDLATL